MTLMSSLRAMVRGTLAVALVGPLACGPGEPVDTADTGDTADSTDPTAVLDTTTPTDTGATGGPAVCLAPPTPTFAGGGEDCPGGIGFEQAVVSIAGVPVVVPEGGPEGEFNDRVVGWQPASHGVTLEFSIDSRSFATGLLVRREGGTLEGMRGELVDAGQGEPGFIAEVTADDAGDLVIPLKNVGLGFKYVFTLENWPADSCDLLSVDILC